MRRGASTHDCHAIFIERVHRLLQAGYAAMNAKAFNTKEEPDISGELAEKIQSLIDDGKCPGISRSWSVMDNAPENQPHLPLAKRRLGKRRKLPDIKFRYGGLRETFYFRFEAKRLQDTGSYEDLIGEKDGLGRFTRREYGRKDSAGGLLGYVQTGTAEIHAARVEQAFAANPKLYRIGTDGVWTVVKWKDGPTCCFRTVHARKYTSETIIIYHSFLSFR